MPPALPATDTRAFFRPVTSALSSLLTTLPPDAWTATAVGSWRVRDVVAHLTDISLRRLSFHRDGHTPPPPPFPIESGQDFVRFINQINADWVSATARLSTRQLADMYARAGAELSAFVETLPVEGPGLFGVSWAGEMESASWFDIGREFTEQWHHQTQIREAVGAPPLEDPAWLRALLEIALRGLPHAYRDQQASDGTAIALLVAGDAGGEWTLERSAGAWALGAGAPPSPAATVTMTDDTAWRLLFNGLDAAAARDRITVAGDGHLAAPLFSARSIVI